MCTKDGAMAELTVQGPEVTATVTARPEVVVGSISKSELPKVCGSGPVNEIVCVAFLIVNVCVTSGAAVSPPVPACEAVIEQLPAPVTCTVTPATSVQVPLAPKVTRRLADEVAQTAKSGSPPVGSASGAAPRRVRKRAERDRLVRRDHGVAAVVVVVDDVEAIVCEPATADDRIDV